MLFSTTAALPPSGRGLKALLAGVCLLGVVHSWVSSCDHDEVEHLHVSYLVSQGQLPFVDFLEHHHPTLHYLLAPLVRALDGRPVELVFAARLLDLGLVVAVLWLVVRLSGSLWAAVLLLGSWTFLRNALEVRPDPWMNLFCLLSLWLAQRTLDDDRPWAALLSGLALGVATLFLPKSLVFGAALGAGAAVLWLTGRLPGRRLSRATLLAALGAALPLGLGLLFVYRSGTLGAFSFWNYGFNQFFYLGTTGSHLLFLPPLAVATGEDPLLWALGLSGAGLALAQLVRRREQGSLPVLCAAAVLGMGLFFARSNLPFQHNLLMLLGPLSILAAQALERLSATRWLLPARVIALLMLGKVAVLCLVYQENLGHREVQAALLAASRPDQTVYAPPPYNPIFRRDPSFFWFDAVKKSRSYVAYCAQVHCPGDAVFADQRGWNEHPAALVYLPAGEPEWWPAEWEQQRARYREDPSVPGLYRRLPEREPEASRATTGAGRASATEWLP